MSILKAIVMVSMVAALMAPARAAELPAGTYDLVSLGESKLPAGPAPFLTVDGIAIKGRSLCNSFSGEIIWKPDGSAEPGVPLRATMMACADGARQALDARLMAALGAVERFSVDGGRLVLTTGSGEIVALRKSHQ